ncbi:MULTISPECIES: trypsin-like serine peptidase [Acinetobacter]|uniref:trypsin-like serine peptidase n=1 Tax=Acinetobacter TaxID=469 RepID=UPI000D006067|nr:trypsin-like peptidase domain-containing protein [Acinetobacter sp. MYb10]QLD63055.1 trypsin-like peptidase domain-containing protein [Acinetobacter sp. MYb10]
MKVKSATEQFFFTTVKIESIYKEGQVGTGTGFIFRYKNSENTTSEFLVTNKHVINDPKIGRSTHGFFTFITGDDFNAEKPKLGYGFRSIIDSDYWVNAWFGHPNDDVDVAVFVLGPTINYIQNDLNQPIFCKGIPSELTVSEEVLENLDAIEDIYFVGYPNGIWDKVNLLPIVRKGTTATPLQVDYEGNPKFLIDASVFGGSSGSPVFVHNKTASNFPEFMFVGIIAAVYQAKSLSEIIQVPIPTNANFVTEIINSQMIDLGIVYKSKTVIETIEAFLRYSSQAHLIK